MKNGAIPTNLTELECIRRKKNFQIYKMESVFTPYVPHPLDGRYTFSRNPDWDHQIDIILDRYTDIKSVDKAWKLYFEDHLEFPFKVVAESAPLPGYINSIVIKNYKVAILKLAEEAKYPVNEIVFVGRDTFTKFVPYIFSKDIREVADKNNEEIIILYRYWQLFNKTRIGY